MDTVLKNAPVIIEGKVIYVTPAYWNVQTKHSYGHEPYRSYIVKVYKVFKGDVNQQYIEIPIVGGQIGDMVVTVLDGPSMLPIGKIGLLFLTFPPDTDWSAQFYNSGDSLANHFIMEPYYRPYNYDAMWNEPKIYLYDIEKNFYQHIEAITGRKRTIISTP